MVICVKADLPTLRSTAGPTTKGPMPTANSLNLTAAPVTANVQSAAEANPTPPPTALPCTRAITNFGALRIALITPANPEKKYVPVA